MRQKNCAALRDCQTEGIGTEGDDKEAIQWLERSAKNGDESARFSLSKNPYALTGVKSEVVERLLRLVAEGEQDAAEAMIQRNRKLLLAAGTVTDLSGRTFKRITAFQYALWALDWHMWKMLLKYLPGEAAAQQCAVLETKGTTHGRHFSLQRLITALQTYIDHDSWNVDQREKHWCTVVGSEQRRLPVHVVNEYCHRTRSFDPCPDFEEETLPRSRKIVVGYVGIDDEEEWYTAKYDGSFLGDSFAIVRGDKQDALATWWPEGAGWLCQWLVVGNCHEVDHKALQALSQTRTQQLEGLKAWLAQYQPGLAAKK